MSNSKQTIQILIRVNEKIKKQIKAQAAFQNISISDFIRNAIVDYLAKDVNWQGQLQGTINALHNDIRKAIKNIDLFSSLWLTWTEFYFAYTKSFGTMSDEQKKLHLQEGKERSKYMVSTFKKTMSQKPGMVETLLADFLIQEKQEEEN